MSDEESLASLKILIADDSNSDRLLLKSIIQKQGHIPLLAADGLEAIELFNQQSPDIILLDALMPRLDGFETARYIKSNSGTNFVPIIFLTSLSEADSLARCLEVGGDDFLTKPYNHIILQAKINAFRRMLKMHCTLQLQRDQIAEHNERLLREQEVAKLTFDKIAHDGSLNAPNIRYRLSPMAIFNGDVLLAAMRPNGNLCVLLGDFTGHGLAAAVGAMPLSQTFYSMVAKGFSIRDILIEVNAKLKELLPLGVFCCAVLVDMDFRNQQIEVWSGGMPDAYLLCQAQQTLVPIKASHLALGILASEQFSSKTQFFPMAKGDRLYLWSDGILEAENPAGEMFGEQRVKTILQENSQADDLFERINQAVDAFSQGIHRSDDLSIAEICMVDYASFEAAGLMPALRYEKIPADWSLSFELRASSLRGGDPIPVLQKILGDLPGLRPHSGELYTALAEVYSNALEHGVLNLNSTLKSSPAGFSAYYQERDKRLKTLTTGFIYIDIDYQTKDDGSHLSVLVTDSGKGFDVNTLLAQNSPAMYSGRGLQLIHAICHAVEYLGKGNQVKLTFQW